MSIYEISAKWFFLVCIFFLMSFAIGYQLNSEDLASILLCRPDFAPFEGCDSPAISAARERYSSNRKSGISRSHFQGSSLEPSCSAFCYWPYPFGFPAPSISPPLRKSGPRSPRDQERIKLIQSLA
jgi:hypothetical protein